MVAKMASLKRLELALGSILICVSVKRNIEASVEPLTPQVAELLRMRPEDKFTPPSVFETWQNQRKRTEYAEWFSDTWQETASYTATGRPIDGLIMYVMSPL